MHRQFFALREALCLIGRGKKWLNDPVAQQQAENKPLQLNTAASIGMHVPDTLITSDPERVMAFYAAHEGRVVAKQLASSPLPDRVVFTTQLTDAAMAKIQTVRLSPAIFQLRVEKSHELRVTVVGDEVFAAKIFSQESADTAVDWRRKTAAPGSGVRMVSCDIPDDVRAKLQQLMHSLGLRYGCADYIVTPEGKHVFLEINPNGQWVFVQLQTGMRIAKAIARELVR